MTTTTLESFNVIGISVRTTNENMQAATDIPALWNRFISENITAAIPYKMENDIYCLYTGYESDFTKPYTAILGCKVSSLEAIPDGFTGKAIAATTYKQFTATGKIDDGVVFHKWQEIWSTDLPRAYVTDFEVYGGKASDPNNAEIDIFIGIK